MAENPQILKLTLLFEFGQVESEILPKNKLQSFFWTWCIGDAENFDSAIVAALSLVIIK